jgi:hypothetical protein
MHTPTEAAGNASTIIDHLDLIERLHSLTIQDTVEATASDPEINLRTPLLTFLRSRSERSRSLVSTGSQTETETVYFHSSRNARAYHLYRDCRYLQKASAANGEIKSERKYKLLLTTNLTLCQRCLNDERTGRKLWAAR